MAFSKKQIPVYPRRHWQIVGRAGTGKSTFAMRMRAPLLPIDADHRIDQVAHLNPEMLELSSAPADHNDTDRIAHLLNTNMPGATVGTILIDSLTAIIAPLVTQAMVDKDAGRIQNLWAGFRPKALAMRQLQDAITKWGTDTLWIFHLDDSTNAEGKALVKETISKTELARLMRSVNLKLEVIVEKGRRGVVVKWARRGRSGKAVGTLWDETGTWLGMPERIERAVYDGLSQADQDRLERALPETFDDDATAIAWGLEFGSQSEPPVFAALAHARNAFEKLMRENGAPTGMDEKAALWSGDVLARVEEKNAARAQNGNGGNGHAAKPASEAETSKDGPTLFWEYVRAQKFNPAAAQTIVAAYTLAGKTDWLGARREVAEKVNVN